MTSEPKALEQLGIEELGVSACLERLQEGGKERRAD
jgi:hypothetical protein